jgi:recombination protein RecA
MGDTHVGLQARLMSQAMRKLTGVIAQARNCTVIFINQIREKIGVMFGSPETTPGGRALKFYSSVRIDIRRTGAIKDGDENVGNRVRAKVVVKNKVAPPFRIAEFDIMFNEGISATGDLLDLAVDQGRARSRAWFSYGEIRLGQGRERVVEMLEENTDLLETIQTQVFAAIEEAERARENKGKNGPEPRKMQGTGA